MRVNRDVAERVGNMEYLQTQELTYSYGQDLPAALALDGVTLGIGKGEFVALLGHNGCGKSTLAKQLNALLLPSGGVVYVDAMDTRDGSLTFEIRRQVGLVQQNPDNQLVASVVEEDVAFGPENIGIPPAEIRERVDAALQAVGMYEYREQAPHKLSGGQKQRIAIAGILAMEPACIVLDEPTAMLDPRGRQEVLETVWKLNREKGITVVLITHYMEEAAQADRVVVMDRGKVLLDGTPREVFSQVDLLQEHALDVPQATELLALLRREGCEMRDDVLTVEECVRELEGLLGGTQTV